MDLFFVLLWCWWFWAVRRDSESPGASTSAQPHAVTLPPGCETLPRGRRARNLPTRAIDAVKEDEPAVTVGPSLGVQSPLEPIGHRLERVIRVAHRGETGRPQRVELPTASAALRCRFSGP